MSKVAVRLEATTAIAKIQPRKQLPGQIYQVLDSVKSF